MMSNRTSRLLATGFLVAAMGLVAAPGGVVASCLLQPSLQDAINAAESVFVGTVTATRNGDRWATVTIEEIWRGPDLAQEVVIKGGPDGTTATSVDRTFVGGQKYLFFPYLDPQAGLSDNNCSNTMPWTEDLVALRPSTARPPIGGSTTGTEPGGFDIGTLAPLGVVGVVFLAILAIGLLARGRQDA